MKFDFLSDLSESRLMPSKMTLKSWKPKKLSELAYLYFLGLHILLSSKSEKKWAESYCQKVGKPNDFDSWLNAQNDLYALLYALSDSEINEDGPPSSSAIRHWLRHITTDNKTTLQDETHKLFLRLDAMFSITNAEMKKLRRLIMNWEEADSAERQDALRKVIQLIHDRAQSNSEIVPHLKALEKTDDLVKESATTGATSSANVATVVGALGAGFDPKQKWRSIYGSKTTVPIIKRN